MGGASSSAGQPNGDHEIDLAAAPPPHSFAFFSKPKQPERPASMTNTLRFKSDVGIDKRSVRMVANPQNPSAFNVQFRYDATIACTVTVCLGARQLPGGRRGLDFYSALSALQTFESPSGLQQLFHQPTSDGNPSNNFSHDRVDLDQLLVCSPKNDAWPLVLKIEPTNVQPNEQQGSSGFQCTFAKILKRKSDSGGVLVGVEIVKQTFVFQGLVYSLDDVFGQGSNAPSGNPVAQGAPIEKANECVVCLTAQADTMCMPCRHLCLCYDCAEVLTKSKKCPICREYVGTFAKV